MREGATSLIVILGAARSGTKLLRDLIALHPLVAAIPYDVNFIWRLGNQSLPHDELSPASLTPALQRRIARRLERFSQGHPFLVEKTVGNCVRVPFVQAIFPDARFIQIPRDGADVIESVWRQWTAPPDWAYLIRKGLSFSIGDTFRYSLSFAANTVRRLGSHAERRAGTWGVRYDGIDEDVRRLPLLEVCAIQWKTCLERALESLRDSDLTLTVKYEDLVAEPVTHLNRIGEFVGLGANAYENRLQPGRVSTANLGKGRRALTPEQIALVAPHLDPVLGRLGYPPLRPDPV